MLNTERGTPNPEPQGTLNPEDRNSWNSEPGTWNLERQVQVPGSRSASSLPSVSTLALRALLTGASGLTVARSMALRVTGALSLR